MAPPRRRPSPPRTRSGARLTGGEAAGRRLLTVSGDGLRASTGLVRAACFNILAAEVQGALVVDLFAGAGSLGLEALSRGASRATFVELRPARAQLISANLASLGWTSRAQVVVGDALAWIRGRPSELTESGLVLLDPPYQDLGPQLCLDAIRLLGEVAARLTAWDPVVVVEHHRDLSVLDQVGALNCVRTAKYGTTVLSFYRRLP
ncbi:MAG: 16S rRNA (guanine(966)-N(2))-methyltransferase RsmD [Candidatus Dormiibacterota bacterium]